MIHPRFVWMFACAIVCLVLSIGQGPARGAESPARPIPAIDHVLIISIDGLRPDLLLRADTPVLHQMLHDGSFTFWARTTAVAVTLPSHVSMLTGCTPAKHGIEWNSDLPFTHPIYPNVPTIFELAHAAGYTTAMAAGKTKFQTLNKPGTIDWVWIPTREPIVDDDVAVQAIQIIHEHKPQVMFVHFPNVDNIGHLAGWGTPQQVDVIGLADLAVGRVMDAYKGEGLLSHTLVIVTADHGGAGKSHGPDDPRSRHIPWIAVGPTVRAGLDLTTIGPLEVQTYDTFATACWVMGLRPSPNIDGKVVREIFSQQELMQSSAPATQAAGGTPNMAP